MKITKAAKTAKPKASASPKPSANLKPPSEPEALSPPDPTPEYDPSKDRRALRELIARRGQVDSDYRAAYDELIDDAGRAALGAKTRAPAVLREAVEWAVQIDHALSTYPALVKAHYAETRFAYFLERTARLGDAVAAQQERRGDQQSTRSTAQERESAARAARGELISRLRGFAGRRDTEGRALTDALERLDNDADPLGSSIQRLTRLGTEWLARPEKSAQIQAASAGLTASVVSAALSAGEALTGSASDATLAGRRPALDAPEVNLFEGAVLHEMEEAQRCFDEAHAATQIIARLTPGPATRHVLGKKKSPKPAPTEPVTAPASGSPTPST